MEGYPAVLTLENSVGRFCEIRANSEVTARDLLAFRARMATIFHSLSARVVICSDLRDCASLPADVVTSLVAIGRIDNPRIERHAMLVTSGQTIASQMDQVIRESHNANRRLFMSGTSATAWLDEMLNPAEAMRLRAFLG